MSLHLLSRKEAPQGSQAWLTARLGRLTSSRASDMLATRKDGKEAAARRDYRMELAVERITGVPADDTFVTRDMQYGLDMEPKARAVYEATTGQLVRESGFAYLDDLMTGTSVDGFVGDDGIVELKCPKATTHLGYILDPQSFLDAYNDQCRHHLFVTGREWVDLTSYREDFPEQTRQATIRLHRGDFNMIDYGLKVTAFLQQVAKMTSLVLEAGA